MASFHHLYRHIKTYGTGRHKPLYVISLMLFFLSLFDGLLAYLLPIKITNSGLNPAIMGLIIGSASLIGAIFDFFLSKFVSKTHFRRFYLSTLILCALYSVVLWQAKTIPIFILAMALWGFYFDLMNFGNYDFVGRFIHHEEHASSFGVMYVFKSLGYFIAPLIAVLLINEATDIKPFAFSWMFLLIAALIYLIVNIVTKKRQQEDFQQKKPHRLNVLAELRLWHKIGRQFLPVLIFAMLINVFDAFFWTIGPLFAQNLEKQHFIGGLLLPAYSLPPLIIGWFIGIVARKYGKKRTAFFSFLFCSLFLSLATLFHNPFLVIIFIFFSSFLGSFTWPAIRATYADYISETTIVEKEIEGLADFSANLGYFIGPIIAGYLSYLVGNAQAFTILGVTSTLVTLIVIKITPREVNVKVPSLKQVQ